MGDKSKISWCDATWNPIRGCSRVSEGCRNCYAERVAARFSGPGQPYEGLVRVRSKVSGLDYGTPRAAGSWTDARWNGEVRFVAEHLADPLRWRKPRRIFVNSMSDLFHERLTNEQIAAVFGVMAASTQHTFQVLTKRAKRMREWFAWIEDHGRLTCTAEAFLHLDGEFELHGCDVHDPWPLPNVWLGVSVENQAAADERIPDLLATPAAVRFLSCEPLIGPLDFSPWNEAARSHRLGDTSCDDSLHWIIAGCESGQGARPCDVTWIRSLRDQCADASVPFFLKQARESDMGMCGDADNPNGDDPCGERVRYFVHGPKDSSVSCGCTVEGAEDANGCPPVGSGDGSHRKAGGVIELPYLDGVQHASFPEVA